MLINKSGTMLVIGRLKIRTGECVPGIALTAGEKKAIESFTKAGYLVEEKPATVKAEVKAEAPKTTAEAAPKAEKSEKQK